MSLSVLTQHKSVDEGACSGDAQDEATDVESNQTVDESNTYATKEQSQGA